MNTAELAQILDLTLRYRHERHNALVLVSSPPGAGKTWLLVMVAAVMNHLGLRVAVACPGYEQTLAIVRRLLAACPWLGVRLWIGQDRILPRDLRQRARQIADDGYLFGPDTHPPIDVATVHKFAQRSQLDLPPYDHLLCDEAFQVTLADYLPLLPLAERHLLIGDPGQLPPQVRIDTDPFEALPFRVHWPAPAELGRHNPQSPSIRLAQTRRLPPDSAQLLQPFYPDLPFTSAVHPAQRRVRFVHPGARGDAVDRALDRLAGGASLVALVLPALTAAGSGIDQEATSLAADVVARVLERGMIAPNGHVFGPRAIACVDPHVASGNATTDDLRRRGIRIVSDTPEILQGGEWPFVVALHPLLGGGGSAAFDLEPGRLCVALSRHQFGCALIVRADLERTLRQHSHDFGRRSLGSPDRLWQGLQAQLRLWGELRRLGRLVDV